MSASPSRLLVRALIDSLSNAIEEIFGRFYPSRHEINRDHQTDKY